MDLAHRLHEMLAGLGGEYKFQSLLSWIWLTGRTFKIRNLDRDMFQSLLSWIWLTGSADLDSLPADDRFQSLLSWIWLTGGDTSPAVACRSGWVSILVVVDLAHRQIREALIDLAIR